MRTPPVFAPSPARMLACRYVLIFLAATTTLLTACEAQGGGRRGGGDAPEGVGLGGAGGDPTPVLTGTWEGTFEVEGQEARTAMNLEQGADGKLAGSASIAFPPDIGVLIEDVAGRVKGFGDVSFSYVAPGEGSDTRFSYEGALKEGAFSKMEGEVSVAAEGEEGGETEAGTFELTRYPDLSSDPRALAVAAVQAVYDRNFAFLAENAHPDYEEFLQEERYPTDFSAPTLAGAIQNQFEDETAGQSWDKPPPAGVTVEFHEASVREEEQTEDGYYVTFDHGLSNGGEGYAEVALRTTGVDEATAWRVDGIGLEYAENERLTLADTY